MTDYNNGKWHGWNGGECPVHPETEIEIVTDSGCSAFILCAPRWVWSSDAIEPIRAFRVVKGHREPRECWISKVTNVPRWSRPGDECIDNYIHVREVRE